MTELVPDVICRRPSVAMFTAPNPGPMTLTGTHTYVVGDADVYVIDPGPLDLTYQEQLAEWIERTGLRVQGILLTHGHPDHAAGSDALKSVLGASVWASEEMSLSQREAIGVDRHYERNTRFTLPGGTIHVLPAPGHTPDHVVMWLPECAFLFAGDAVLGEGTTLISPSEGDMALYMDTLFRLQALNARLIAPGHGPLITDPSAKLEQYIEHRRERERQILEALREGPSTCADLVSSVYTDVDSLVRGLAAQSVEAQLIKLEHEGKVSRDGERFGLATLG